MSSKRQAQGGFTFVEVTTAMVVVVTGLLAMVASIDGVAGLQRATVEMELAADATKGLLEQMRSADPDMLFQTYSTQAGKVFDIPGLEPIPGVPLVEVKFLEGLLAEAVDGITPETVVATTGYDTPMTKEEYLALEQAGGSAPVQQQLISQPTGELTQQMPPDADPVPSSEPVPDNSNWSSALLFPVEVRVRWQGKYHPEEFVARQVLLRPNP